MPLNIWLFGPPGWPGQRPTCFTSLRASLAQQSPVATICPFLFLGFLAFGLVYKKTRPWRQKWKWGGFHRLNYSKSSGAQQIFKTVGLLTTRWCQWCSATFPLKMAMSTIGFGNETSKWNQPNMWNSTPSPISICSCRENRWEIRLGAISNLSNQTQTTHTHKFPCLFLSHLYWVDWKLLEATSGQRHWWVKCVLHFPSVKYVYIYISLSISQLYT